ncbi:MAG: DUF2357 domain-containing protein [Marinisporobacter sp.]|jgi:hypothetical protein|nr:DUF2357 domain-containing protein [Marinisporobacter sp.]
MDMQIRVIFEINITSNKGVTLKTIPKKICINQFENIQQQCIEFFEYNNVSAYIESDNSEDLLEIESFKSVDGMPVQKKAGEKIQISPGGDHPNMLVPGYYTFKVISENQVYEGLYKIKPSNLSWEVMEDLREYLESKVRGLAYDLYKQRLGMNVDGLENPPSVFEIYRKIENAYNSIINCLNTITRNPIDNIIKVYKEKHYSVKPDIKSQRWLSKKGIARNTNSFIPNIVWEKHSLLTINTIENKWIKKIIYFLLNVLRELENSFLRLYIKTEERIKTKRNEKERIYNKYLSMNGVWALEKRRQEAYKGMEFIEREIKELDKKLCKTQENIDKIKQMKGTFSYYMHETWLNNITNYLDVHKPSLKLLKNPNYAYLYNLYKNIATIQRKKQSSKDMTFPFKKSSLLFEYYIVGIVIEIMLSLGYKWDKGWLADEENPLSDFIDLTPETTINFYKNDYKLELVYDTEIKQDDRDYSKSRFIAINSKHRRPDIRLALYKNGDFLSGLIVEVKYCKVASVYDPLKRGATPVVEQLIDYYKCDYCKVTENGVKLVNDPFYKIIAVYPKQKGAIEGYTEYFENILFQQIEPAKTGEIPFGYEELKKQIIDFLENYAVT